VNNDLECVPTSALEKMVGVSAWSHHIRDQIVCVGQHSSNVLILGKSGTGKELIARAVHENSARSGRAFIPVDCASITSSLFGSHMFGHLKGSFSGATYTAVGSFRAADGGTIFLDEIGELELSLQAKLLRVLQQRTVVPVGSHEEIPIDVRLIAATNRNLREEASLGRFRDDLLFRLNVVTLETVPLCERTDDINALADHILAKLSIDHGLPSKQLSHAARQQLIDYSWPGNVRELENALERAVLFAAGEVLMPGDLPPGPGKPQRSPTSDLRLRKSDGTDRKQCPSDQWRETSDVHSRRHNEWPTMVDIECEHIRMTLERTAFNQTEAARLLGMDRYMLRRRMVKFGIPFSRSKRGRPPLRPR